MNVFIPRLLLLVISTTKIEYCLDYLYLFGQQTDLIIF